MEIRPYDPTADRDRAGLWRCKREFEVSLADDPEKRRAYEGKLTAAYGERYLDWVRRCVEDQPRAVQLVDAGESGVRAAEAGESGTRTGGADDSGTRAAGPDGSRATGSVSGTDEGTGIVGYAFVLPERLAMIWDAAVLNEIYLDPDRRGSGVADDLMDAALAVAREQSLPLDRLVLDVDRENDRAREFYRRHGFEHWGEMVARPL